MNINEQHTSTKGTIPDQLGSNAKCARHTKEDSVERHLVHSVVGKKNARVSVHVGPGVLGFASLV